MRKREERGSNGAWFFPVVAPHYLTLPGLLGGSAEAWSGGGGGSGGGGEAKGRDGVT